MSVLEFKQITKKDYRQTLKIIRKSYKEVADELSLRKRRYGYFPAFMTKRQLKEKIKRNYIFLGLFKNGKQIGCVSLAQSKKCNNGLILEHLCILPKYKKRGLGQYLLDKTIDFAKIRKADVISLSHLNGLQYLNEFYSSNGFKNIFEEEIDEGMTLRYMIKKLT